MAISRQFSLIFVLLHFCSVGIVTTDTEIKDYPCPLDEEFSPCICTENAELTLDIDCSAAKTEEELSIAFSTAQFPFVRTDSLLIDHTSCTDCDLNILTPDTFGPVNFRTVQIHGTALATVIEGAFAKSEEYLEVWDLSENKINFFTFEVIETFLVLETLNLKGNALDDSIIVPDITSSTLKNLYLSNNPMVLFGPNLVSNCPELEDLQLSNISLTEIPQIVQDTTSMFDGLSNLRSLDLSYNMLTELESSTINTGTQSLLNNVNLSHNSIEILHLEFIANVGATGLLDMNNNLITLLDEEVWQPIFHSLGKGAINLEYNPLVCGCDMAWLVLDPDLMLAMDPDTTCSGGSIVVELPPAPFQECEEFLLKSAGAL